MRMYDAVALDGVRFTDNGYLVAKPKVARSCVQLYTGAECGRPELGTVRVYRPIDAVFDRNAMHSFAHRPITLDHPSEHVDARNWKKHAVGQSGDEVVRDGDAIVVPLVLMDHQAIDAVKSGKNQLSVGYDCSLEFRSGVTASGEAFYATQSNIYCNHIALVDTARGGPTLPIGDAAQRMALADAAAAAVAGRHHAVPPRDRQLFADATAARDAYIKNLGTAWQRPQPTHDGRHVHTIKQTDPMSRAAATYEYSYEPDEDEDDTTRDSSSTTTKATDARRSAYETYCRNLQDAWQRGRP